MTGLSAHRAGFAAILGRPNVGKSTLLNHLLREKVAIVSDKPQTTRNRIRGILTEEGWQIVFIDTPGIHRARDEINRYMVQAATNTLKEVDLILFLVEPVRSMGKGDVAVGRLIEEAGTPALLVINKTDTVSEETVAESRRLFGRRFPSMEVHAVSALEGHGTEELLKAAVKRLPEGPAFFPPDQIADQPVRFLCAELIREKVFELTGEEVPYAVAVEILSFREPAEEGGGIIRIDANIHVDRPSQKGILIGRGGGMVKEVGTLARKDMEALLGARVHLNLWVKVTRGWRNDPNKLKWLGYS